MENGSAHDMRQLLAQLNQGAGAATRSWREQAKLSQRELAELVSEVLPEGWKQSTVAKVEAGVRSLKWIEVFALAWATGRTRPEDFVSELDRVDFSNLVLSNGLNRLGVTRNELEMYFQAARDLGTTQEKGDMILEQARAKRLAPDEPTDL